MQLEIISYIFQCFSQQQVNLLLGSVTSLLEKFGVDGFTWPQWVIKI